MLIIPITTDTKDAISRVTGLLSDTTRSFEVWWDKQEKDMAFILTSHSELDLQRYKTALSNMYPNCMFVDLEYYIPEWFDSRYDHYQIFDVGLYHGHYATTFDKLNNDSHQLVTQLANLIQLTDKAWIQFVFASYDFTLYLKWHINRLDQKIKFVTDKNYRTLVDDLANKKPYENPENGKDFANHYKELRNQVAQKMQNPQIIMSIRGLVQSKNNDITASLFNDIKSRNDHLSTYNYTYSDFYNFKKPKSNFIKINNKKINQQRIQLFESRLIPSPQKFLKSALSNYFEKSILGNYKDRRPLPFLILNPDELSLFIHLPEPTVKNLKTTRNVSLPSRQTNKTGFSLGYTTKRIFEPKNDSIYGNLIKSSDSDCAVISPEDFARHIYCVGGTGAGKTTLIRQIAKHLETSNLNQTFPNSFVYLDPKGDDSLKFIQQCDKGSIQDNNSVHFLDPIKTNFSINPLELPRYNPEERQQIVSRYVGYFMEIVRQWYGQQQSFVQMERIFRVLLYYMYLNNDAPTFLDMYEIIIHIQEEQEAFLQTMFHALGMPGDELKQALTSIATLKPESFTPLLNRVEQFATDPILKKVFCVRHGTVSFEKLTESGQYTIVRISALHIPHHVQPLAIQAFVIKLWFTIQERAARIENEQDRNYVILAMDEFQMVKDLQVLPMILSQARSYRLGLLLSHQTTAQISESLLEEITGNCGTQLAGRISGKDASKLANIWDPKFSKQIQQQLASQEDFHWTIQMRANPGSEQPTPLQFWLHNPPKLSQNEEELKQFITNQHNLYRNNDKKESDDTFVPVLQQHHLKKNRWLKYITVNFIQDKTQWLILVQLYWNKSLNLTDITKNIQAKNRDYVSAILQDMLKNEYIIQINKSRNVKYALSKKTKKTYFDFDSRLIGTAKDIPKITRKAVEAYLEKGLFVTLALQKIEKDEDRSDLIAYSYDAKKSISVEIESASELSSHPEHTRYNMSKWKKMGFDACHLWSSSPKLSEIHESQIPDEDKKDVEVFIV